VPPVDRKPVARSKPRPEIGILGFFRLPDPQGAPMRTVLLRLPLLLLLLSAPPAAASLDGLDDYIASGMRDWKIPGLAVAVVRDDEIIYARGFGTRRLGRDEGVDERTLFGVASTTKAMTAAVLGMLVDEGLINWDDRVIDHLPEFRLSDPWVTAEVRIRDLLTHRVGVGRLTGNRLQFMTHRPRSEIMYRLRHHEFEQPFRSRSVYSNVMYMVAGEIVPAVTGKSWDEFMVERLFTPLGMDDSNTSITAIGHDANAAWPHQEIDGEVVAIPRRNFDNVGPSASVNASVRDMAQWMRMHLGEPGVFDGERILSEAVMREMHAPQFALGRRDREDDVRAYGLGWGLDRYRGYAIAQHGGATDGMNTQLVLVPELDLGIVVTSNLFNDFRVALAQEIIDRIAGLEKHDWNAEMLEQDRKQRQEAQQARDRIHAERQRGTRPSMPFRELAGRYHNDLYDGIEVVHHRRGDRLELRFWDDDSLIADLEHWHHDTYRAIWRNRAQREKFVHFTRDRDGTPAAIHVTFYLRHDYLPVGIYPAAYQRTVSFDRVDEQARHDPGPE
jgi:CubicO group peptidase (beta-lactamase class C family)